MRALVAPKHKRYRRSMPVEAVIDSLSAARYVTDLRGTREAMGAFGKILFEDDAVQRFRKLAGWWVCKGAEPAIDSFNFEGLLEV